METSCFQKGLRLRETAQVMRQNGGHGTVDVQALGLRLHTTFTHNTHVVNRAKETSAVTITRRTLGLLGIELERTGGCGRRSGEGKVRIGSGGRQVESSGGPQSRRGPGARPEASFHAVLL